MTTTHTTTQQRIEQQLAEYDRTINAFVSVDEGSTETVRALCTTLEQWVLTEYKKEARVSTDEDMRFHDVVICRMLRMIELVVTLEAKINYERNWKSYLVEKEVNRD
ncbi:hypothetical protein [Spirosoma validum]|uniref:Uncharacterized protein n=1 Tax=Spirosoma validum TaxID=2771355 RepID=A0A927AZJ9_9BACT|nr:hypothetical protein [Spirosoma validum]MBD2752628.1 hypothetical protein [Spirosoma validum]